MLFSRIQHLTPSVRLRNRESTLGFIKLCHKGTKTILRRGKLPIRGDARDTIHLLALMGVSAVTSTSLSNCPNLALYIDLHVGQKPYDVC